MHLCEFRTLAGLDLNVLRVKPREAQLLASATLWFKVQSIMNSAPKNRKTAILSKQSKMPDYPEDLYYFLMLIIYP